MTALACDLGGTRTKLGIVRGGQVLAQSIVPSNSKLGLALLLPVLKAEWLRLLKEPGLSLSDCKGVGVSFPSLIDYSTARILDAYGKFDDAMDIDLRAWSRAELGLPLAIENDARMACIGEWQQGAGRGSENLVMVTLGTGLGTCVIMEVACCVGFTARPACWAVTSHCATAAGPVPVATSDVPRPRRLRFRWRIWRPRILAS